MSLNYLRIAKALGATLHEINAPVVFGPMHGAAISAQRFRLLRDDEKRRQWTKDEHEEMASAFSEVHKGYELDRVIIDPALSRELIRETHARGVKGTVLELNKHFQAIRKYKHYGVKLAKATKGHGINFEPCLYAAEIGWVRFRIGRTASVDTMICDPRLGDEYVKCCREIAQHGTAMQFKWAALYLRKRNVSSRNRARILRWDAERIEKKLEDVDTLNRVSASSLSNKDGFFSISELNGHNRYLYVGSGKLNKVIAPFEDAEPFRRMAGVFWKPKLDQLVLRISEQKPQPKAAEIREPTPREFSLRLIEERHPLFNFPVSIAA